MKEAIVLYPAPGMGHVVSMVELAKLILRSYSTKFSVHILLTTSAHPDPAVDSYLHHHHSNFTLHRLPPLLSSLPRDHTTTTTTTTTTSSVPNRSPAAVAFEFIRLNADNVRRALRQISQTSSTVSALILDFFCTSALPIAADLGIPTYYFFTSGAAALAAYLYFPTIHEQINGSFKDLVSTQLRIPGLPMLRATHMPEPVLDSNDPAYHDILYFSLHLPKSNGIIVNTFEKLEPIPIKAIQDELCTPNAPPIPPIYHLGPIISEPDHNSPTAAKHKCLTWLDSQPSKSVVFLCFGSRGSFSADQVKEIANGLEKSGHRFLWVVKNPPSKEEEKSKQIQRISTGFDVDDLMPSGFLERTEERGMVVGSWAPQVVVLSHDSVGGFVTHCGWNSVLEAVTAGVPMIAWPLYAEQHLNKAALVEDMKMAIAVEQREGDGFVSGAELERRVRELMESESGRQLRERSLKMKEEASAAWGESGSSTIALTNLARILSSHS